MELHALINSINSIIDGRRYCFTPSRIRLSASACVMVDLPGRKPFSSYSIADMDLLLAVCNLVTFCYSAWRLPMLSWYLCSFQCPLNCEIRMASWFCFSPIISSLLAKRIMSSILGIVPSSLGALPSLICFLAFCNSSIVYSVSYYFNVMKKRVNVTQRCVFKGGSQQVLEMLIPLLFPFFRGFLQNFPDAAALRLVIVLTIFQALLGSTTLNALSTSPIWYLISCYSRSLYTACKSLLASILVTTSGLFSSCGCYIFLWFFRFSFVVDNSCIVQASNLFSFSNKRESGCPCIFACLY